MEQYLKNKYKISDEWIQNYKKGLHIQFEEADMRNDKKVFQKIIDENHYEFVYFHVMFTFGVFDYHNFFRYINQPYPSLIQANNYLKDVTL